MIRPASRLMGYTFNWTLVLSYAPQFVAGLLLGLGMAVVSLAIGSRHRLAAASRSHARWRPVRWLVRGYVEVFRNVPILLWTYFAYYGMRALGIGSSTTSGRSCWPSRCTAAPT